MAAAAGSVKIHLVPLGLLLRISHRQQAAASVEPAISFGGGRGEGDIVALKNYMNTQYFGEIGIDQYSAAKVHCHIRRWQLQPLGAVSQVLLLDCVLLPLSLQVLAVKHLSEEWSVS
uniref:Uncharacterized protein n=1 Tax=Oryza punctata TaxID=4537 RepID=A0A0E0MPY4_ORYPU